MEVLDPTSSLPSPSRSPLYLTLIDSAARAQLDPDPEEMGRNCPLLHPLKIRPRVYVTDCGLRSQPAGTLAKSWCSSTLCRVLAVTRPDAFS